MGARFLDCFNQLFNDMGRCGHIRITHAEVDDIPSVCPRLRLQPIYLFKDIGWQALYTVKFEIHLVSSYVGRRQIKVADKLV